MKKVYFLKQKINVLLPFILISCSIASPTFSEKLTQVENKLNQPKKQSIKKIRRAKKSCTCREYLNNYFCKSVNTTMSYKPSKKLSIKEKCKIKLGLSLKSVRID